MARILVIEDDPYQRDIYSKLLYYNGFDVECAEDAEDGVRVADAHPPDAILMDVVLPQMNGLEAARVFKSRPSTADIPVICMSAYNISPFKARNSGADDFLQKPVSGDVLVRSIRHFIGWDDYGH